MKAVSHQLQRVSPTDTTVLLLGESGTGKELFARAAHHLSNRRDQPFIALNCAAIPEGLVENELFGHERGAFTGAGNRKAGKIEMAQRGTLFLDEIGELPLASQAKLLRVIEERCFERVGGTQSIEVDVRIIVATNRDLVARVREKLFREDLYFRISAVPLTIPPLRERADDLFLLAAHFLEKFGREFGKGPLSLSESGRRKLHSYPWPGNVRELQNALERAAILTDGPEIAPELLPSVASPIRTESAPLNLVPDSFSWEGSLEDVTNRALLHVERILLENALRECRWNKTRAAEKLGIAPKTLLTKMRATGLEEKP
jgi:transcriptional regulator with GAF, ATPase, and Fis domain